MAIVGGGTAGLACANRLLQLLADDPETDGAPRRGAGRGHREGQDLRRAQPVGRGHAPAAAAGAVPRPDARGLAQGGLRLRRGHQGGRLHAAQRQGQAAHPDAAAVQEPRQRGHLGLGAGALPAAPGRGGRRLRPHRDRRRRSCSSRTASCAACARATRAAARRASRSATSSPAPTSSRRRRCWPRAAGATSPAPRSASSTSARTASRRSGSSASRRSGRSPSRWTA